MLTELSIRNLGLIGNATIEFAPGLSVISGETGAGKSMLLSAIHLLTGGRANASSVGKLSDQLSVDSCWEIPDDSETGGITRLLDELGAEEDDDGNFHLSRTVKADGKSRAILGGRPTTAKVLGSVSGELLSIHGQADQLKLRDGAEQLRILDNFGLRSAPALAALESYSRAYRRWRSASQTLKEVQSNAAAKRREISALRSFIEDYESVDPQPGELETLEVTVGKLQNHEKIKERLLAAQSSFESEDFSPLVPIELATEELRKLKALDPDMAELHDLAADICAKLEELTRALDLELDRSDDGALEELGEAQGRIVEIKGLLKRTGTDGLEYLDDEVAEARKSLDALSVYDRPLDELKAELETARSELLTEGERLRKLRQAAGIRLAKKVNGELGALAMGSTVFAVAFEEAEPSSSGLDGVSFTIQQRGQDPQPMGRSASGGELSRLMLALELSVAGETDFKTYIFDEADAGVGGATAHGIGKRLARLAQHHQVIVVSHLAQIAAYADSLLKVEKVVNEKTTTTSIRPIEATERPVEIARMLSGSEDSDVAKAHAVELMQQAEVFVSTLTSQS